MPLPKLSVSNIKDVIYIVSVIIAVIFYFREKTITETEHKIQDKLLIDNQNNILEKLKEIDVKFEKQAETNGKVLEYIRVDSPR